MRPLFPILGSSQSGFSLLEISLVLIILGIVGGVSLHTLSAHLTHAAYAKTREHQDYALHAIAAFVERHHRFPCPADPKTIGENYGLEPRERKCPGSQAEGILPFRTLGMGEKFAKDGFNHWITYVVDSNLADKDHEAHIETVTGKQIILQNEYHQLVLVDPAPRTQNFIAFLLISHGKSGIGAFVGGTRLFSSTASPHKKENCDRNFIFIDSPQTDDIIRWESRDHFFKHYLKHMD